MAVDLIGGNPGLTLFDEAGERTAYASAWRVDWSVRGPGHALVLWHDGDTRIVTTSPALGLWLADTFVRHFPEVAGLPWPAPELVEAPVDWRLDLEVGFRVVAGDVELDIAEPFDRRLAATDSFRLGAAVRGFSTVLMPCRLGTIRVGGVALAGRPQVDEAAGRSSAFLADAEVWTDGVA